MEKKPDPETAHAPTQPTAVPDGLRTPEKKKDDSPHWFSKVPLALALYFVFCDGKKPDTTMPKPAVKKPDLAPMPREIRVLDGDPAEWRKMHAGIADMRGWYIRELAILGTANDPAYTKAILDGARLFNDNLRRNGLMQTTMLKDGTTLPPIALLPETK